MADNQGYKIVKGFNTNAGLTVYDYDSLANKPNIEGMIQNALEEFVPPVDNTLMNDGQAADAKATGDALSALNEKIGSNSVEEQINQSEQKVTEQFNQSIEEQIGQSEQKITEQFNQSIEEAISAIPPNQTLTFEGAVEATYDGSVPIAVAIPIVDNSLEVEGNAADAKATGEAIGAVLKKMDEEIGSATKTYVDEKFSNIEIPEIPEIPEFSGFIAQPEAPTQYNVLWIDTNEESIDSEIENVDQIHELAADAYSLASQADKKVETLREVVSKFHSNIVEEVKGDIISLDDSSDMELAGLKVYGKTTQNGTPTPDAPVPLENVGDNGSVAVSVTGKNLFGGDALADKVVEVFGGVKDTTAKTVRYLASGSNAQIAIFNQFKPNTRYTIIWTSNENSTGATANLKVEYTDGTSETLRYAESAGVKRQIVFVTSGTKTVNKLRSVNNSGTAYLLYEESGIFEGVLTADDFEAYTAQTLTVRKPVDLPVFLPGVPVTSGGNYTDETGQQWFCDEADFAQGKYVQRIGKIDSYSSENIPGAYISTTASLSEGAAVLYALPDPIEHDLTAEELAQYASLHTNYPSTAIFNDSGADMEVKYVADTKQYIDKKFAELADAILNNT